MYNCTGRHWLLNPFAAMSRVISGYPCLPATFAVDSVTLGLAAAVRSTSSPIPSPANQRRHRHEPGEHWSSPVRTRPATCRTVALRIRTGRERKGTENLFDVHLRRLDVGLPHGVARRIQWQKRHAMMAQALQSVNHLPLTPCSRISRPSTPIYTAEPHARGRRQHQTAMSDGLWLGVRGWLLGKLAGSL